MEQPDNTGSQKLVLICTSAIGAVWIYMGIVPKLIFPDTGEMEMMRGSGIFSGYESSALTFIGIGEALFGILVLTVRKRIIHVLSIVGLLCLAVGAWIGKPEVYSQPFNPFVITVPMVALSLIAMSYTTD